MRIYIHSDNKREPQPIEVEADRALGVLIDEGAEDASLLVEDHDEDLDATVTLEAAGVVEGSHLFIGKRRKTEVEVQFNGQEKTKQFAPSTRVSRTLRWAVGKNGFGLDDEQASQHTLALCGTHEIPAGDVHIGSLDEKHRVCFALVPKHRFEG